MCHPGSSPRVPAAAAITGYRVLAQSSTGANFTTTSPGSPSSLIPGTVSSLAGAMREAQGTCRPWILHLLPCGCHLAGSLPRQTPRCPACRTAAVQRVIEIAPDVYQCGVPYAVSVWSINDAGQSAEPIEYGNGSNTFTPAC